jgi:alkylation response protein AidB-like acyl-CoA dehydrogenase
MSVILSNFNHERWMILSMSLSTQRLIVEECLKYVPSSTASRALWLTMTLSYRWSQQRQAFGKPLSSQAVIRSKLAQMIARVESAQSWLENVTHQMNNVRPPLPSRIPSFWTVSQSLLPRCIYRCHTTSSRRILLERLLSSSSKPLSHFLQHSSRAFLVCRYVTNTGRATAEDAAQIFGGRSITQTGMGKLVENVRHSYTPFIFVVPC